jgi:protein TonB
MHTLAVTRAEQSAALKRGLALSAGIHLTLAVLLFGVLGVARQMSPPPPDDDPEDGGHVLVPPPRYEDPGGAQPPVPPEDFAEPAEIEPVDEDEKQLEDRSEEIARPAEPGPSGDEPGIDGLSPGRGAGGPGGSQPNEGELDPNVYQPHDIEPEVIRRVLPAYPDVARQAGMEGEVIVRVLVGSDGTVRKVEVQRSSALFDEAAVSAVRQWTFRPAIWMDKPVAVWVRIPIVFRMN